ncbi:MAG TPA: MarR family winged helix-turn-helix transcriptional regulator [Thermodesulfobacteriota bacterium]|nr:MarR family winged helix-turn-helix transcriptional regulator [Thermodesulfobacteriota bacterium]
MSSQIARSDMVKCMDCACFNLRKAARAITHLYDEMLRPAGLRTTQFTLLVATKMLEPITVTRLAKIGVMDRTTLTRNLRPLEKQGLVQIALGKDQRTRVVRLTPEGQKALARAFPLWKKAQARVIKELGPERWNSLRAYLGEVVSLVDKN